MLSLAINQMTSPGISFEELLNLAIESGCVGVEARNDLTAPLFSGMSAAEAGALARAKGVQILALAQLNEFNRHTAAKKDEAEQLIQQAADSGAGAVCLIPCNDGSDCQQPARAENLREALSGLAPLLRSAGIIGMVEPLGFSTASIRSKAEVVDAFNELDLGDCFKLVHDTFHHVVGGGGPFFPAHTGIVHISGVTDNLTNALELTDRSRGLVDSDDTLDNIGQIRALTRGGFSGPVSMEAFAPQVKDVAALATNLRDSFNFIKSGLAAEVA